MFNDKKLGADSTDAIMARIAAALKGGNSMTGAIFQGFAGLPNMAQRGGIGMPVQTPAPLPTGGVPRGMQNAAFSAPRRGGLMGLNYRLR